MNSYLNIYEAYVSINGEVNYWGQGSVATFIKLAGCNLSCHYCNTPAKFVDRGTKWDIDDLVDLIIDRGTGLIVLTGGEPLNQKPEIHKFMSLIYQKSNKLIKFIIETNGSVPIEPIRSYFSRDDVCFVIDYKLGKPHDMCNNNFMRYPESNDWIKFPIETVHEIQDALSKIAVFKSNGCKANFALSPITHIDDRELTVEPSVDIEEILSELYLSGYTENISINLQLHKMAGLVFDHAEGIRLIEPPD
jgi:7-carboxy-7-deazaguanine synthase